MASPLVTNVHRFSFFPSFLHDVESICRYVASLIACRRSAYLWPNASVSSLSILSTSPSDMAIPNRFIMASETFSPLIPMPIFRYATVSIALIDRRALGNASSTGDSTMILHDLQYLLSILYFVTTGFGTDISSMARSRISCTLLSIEEQFGHLCMGTLTSWSILSGYLRKKPLCPFFCPGFFLSPGCGSISGLISYALSFLTPMLEGCLFCIPRPSSSPSPVSPPDPLFFYPSIWMLS